MQGIAIERWIRRTAPVVLVTALSMLAAGAYAENKDGETKMAAPLPDIPLTRLDGSADHLGAYRGQVLLIVNVASECGYTPQYEGLQALYARYRERGFSVLGFPSNDFGKQEPGSSEEITKFCRANYGVEFPMFKKNPVLGEAAQPLYRELTSQPAPIGGEVTWNFQKYLVDQDGRVIAKFDPEVTPEDPGVKKEIEALLDHSHASGG
jgi:glutathione peroxidase